MNHQPFPQKALAIIEPMDLQPIHDLARVTWQATYQSFLQQAQIDYMLKQLYEVASLEKQRQEGQVFLLLMLEEKPVAFASYSWHVPDEFVLKLNKLYIHPAYQGFGFGRLLIDEVVRRCQALGGKSLELNVHRKNPAFHFYLKHGFAIHQTVDIPFGPFTLNDHIMRRPLD